MRSPRHSGATVTGAVNHHQLGWPPEAAVVGEVVL